MESFEEWPRYEKEEQNYQTGGTMINDTIENDFTLKPKVIYQPEYKENQLDYWELHEWSYKNYPEFWDCLWQFFDILYTSPYTQVYNKKNGFLDAEWFEGVRFNFTANILKFRDSRTALIGLDDENNTQSFTYNELYDEIKVYIKALKDAGIQKGDVVACYASNKLEPVLAFLATAAIGAIWSACLGLLGSKGILDRFGQINPKILFTVGNFISESTEIRMDLKVPEIVAGIPSLEKVVFIPSKSKGKSEDITRIPKCVLLSEFLAEARRALIGDSSDIEFEQVPFDYPLTILFTSGTTGAPKGLIHSAGALVTALRDLGLHQDCTREDTLLNFAPMGWVCFQQIVNSLHLGLTLIIYEGDAFESSPTRFWDLVDKFGITSSFIRSNTLENMERKGYLPTEKHSLKTFRQISPNGTPCKPHSFDFLSKKVKNNLFIAHAYGLTEVFGSVCGSDSNLPVFRGEIQVFGLGMDVRILDENGCPVIGKRGEIALANPYPALPIGLINDENKEMIQDLYLSKYPGYWYTSDDAWVNPITKGFVVYGRSDETMHPQSVRFSCSEIYSALEGFPGMMDSVCVSQFNSTMDEIVVLFVKMYPGHPLTEVVKEEIKKTIEQHLSYKHVSAIIMEVPDIPYNLVGKKLNILVKKLINKRPVDNVEVVVNPASVNFFKTVNLGEFPC